MKIHQIDLRNIKSTLIVTYCGRSGSYLFSNLMDSHPEVLSCPPESLHHAIGNIIDILSNFVKNPASFTVAKFIDNLTSKHPLLFKETNKDVPDDTGCDPKETNYGVEKNAFKSILMELLYCHFKKYPNSLLVSDVFSLIHWGYALAQGRQLVSTTPIICWQRHIVVLNGNGSQYTKHLVNPIFITTVRRFEDSLDSHLFHMTEECSSKQELCELVVNQFIANLCNKKFQAPQYAIKFEDMHMNTATIMKKLCKLIDIKFDNILLQTTLDNLPYKFERSPGQFITGTNKNLKKKTTFDILNESDILLLNLILRQDYVFYGYEFGQKFLNLLGLDPKSDISKSSLLYLIERNDLFNGSYLIEPMLEKDSVLFLPRLIDVLPHKQQLELIN